jgi:hypothetical protein
MPKISCLLPWTLALWGIAAHAQTPVDPSRQAQDPCRAEVSRFEQADRRPARSARTAARPGLPPAPCFRASSGVAAGLSTMKSASQPGCRLPMVPARPSACAAPAVCCHHRCCGLRLSPGLVWPSRPTVVGRQHGVERAEAGAAAHVAGQAVAEADAVCARVVEKAAAQEQVAGGADGGCRAGVAHQRTVVVVEVDAVRIDRTLAHQAMVVVDRQIRARGRKQLARPAHFVEVLRHMRLDPHAG